VLAELEKRYAGEYVDKWESNDFHCRRLSFARCFGGGCTSGGKSRPPKESLTPYDE
jgi:hypothetical protein